MGSFLRDLRYGCRMLLNDPAPTLVAILALTLAIGANTAIFSVVNGVLLRPLRYADSDRLVTVWENNLSKGIPQFYVNPPNFKEWTEQQHSFDQIAAFRPQPSILTGGGLPERVETAVVSPGIFRLLGAHARLGRAKFPEILHSLRCLAVLEVAPEMILDGRLPRDSTFPHTIYFPRSPDMTLAISTADHAAWVPRLILSSRQRSRAWVSLSRQSTVLMTGTP